MPFTEALLRGESGPIIRRPNVSVLEQAQELNKKAEQREKSATEMQLKEEEKILDAVAEKRASMGVAELAIGVQYTEPIRTGWKPPSYILKRGDSWSNKILEKHRILVEGESSTRLRGYMAGHRVLDHGREGSVTGHSEPNHSGERSL